jgi:nucleoside-diphosphate-sugar epimerase
MSDASNVIDDINDVTLASDAAVNAYLGQFVGASTLDAASNATHTSVASVATTDTLLLAANEHRVKVFIYNNSTSTLYVKYGTGASPTSFDQTIVGAGVLEPVTGYKGLIHFYHSALNGTIEVGEVQI